MKDLAELMGRVLGIGLVCVLFLVLRIIFLGVLWGLSIYLLLWLFGVI